MDSSRAVALAWGRCRERVDLSSIEDPVSEFTLARALLPSATTIKACDEARKRRRHNRTGAHDPEHVDEHPDLEMSKERFKMTLLAI